MRSPAEVQTPAQATGGMPVSRTAGTAALLLLSSSGSGPGGLEVEADEIEEFGVVHLGEGFFRSSC